MLKKVTVFVIITLILTGCYTQKISLNNDKKSGTMVIEYQMDDDQFQVLSMALGSMQTDFSQATMDPIILTDSDLFKESFPLNENFKLKEVNIQTEKGYSGKIVIQFNDFEEALKLIPQNSIPLNIKKENQHYQLSQTIDMRQLDPDGYLKEFINQQKEFDEAIYAKLVNSSFDFELKTSHSILEAKGVKLLNKRQAIYSFQIKDMLSQEDPLVFSLRF
ncbi:MAG: hypothetical protein MJB14_00500 [Spirochaetes bacterium]|nr:hypothetical protein [Spirochaetota bacterium]